MAMKKITFLNLLLVLLVASCQAVLPTVVSTPTLNAPAGEGSTPTPATSELQGSEWILTGINGQAPAKDTFITLKFEANRLGGSAGCNSYGGKYWIQENRLKTDEIAVTLMLCTGPEGVMEQESAYIEILTEATTKSSAAFRVTDQTLEILNALNVPVLSYTRKAQLDQDPAALVGTAWRLENIDGQKPAQAFTLVFLSNVEYSAYAGCRHIFGSYEAKGDDIRFTRMAMVGDDCGQDEARNQAEGEYSNLLSDSTDYHIEAERLNLLLSSGKTISFSPVQSEQAALLAGTSWKLISFIKPGNQPDLPGRTAEPLWPDTHITADFKVDQINGSAGCNSYFAAYTTTDDQLLVEAPGATKKMCEEPEGLMRQEARFLEALHNAKTYRIISEQLWIETSDGGALFLVPASS